MVEITIRKRPRAEAVITQRKFFKKTARGKVIKGVSLVEPALRDCLLFLQHLVLRERYLRDDVGCGIQGCAICSQHTDTTSHPALPVSGSVNHTAFSEGHLLLPDTNVFLAQVCITSFTEL